MPQENGFGTKAPVDLKKTMDQSLDSLCVLTGSCKTHSFPMPIPCFNTQNPIFLMDNTISSIFDVLEVSWYFVIHSNMFVC